MGWEILVLSRLTYPLPLLGALVAKDLVQMGLSLGPGFGLATEEACLTKDSVFLTIEYCPMSSAVCTSPKPLRVSAHH